MAKEGSSDVISLISRGEDDVLVSVTDSELLCPVLTRPKDSVGTLSVGGGSLALAAIASKCDPPLLVMDSPADLTPAAVGEKVTVIVVFPPGEIVAVVGDTVNSEAWGPVVEMLLTASEVFPMFSISKVCRP